MSICMMTYNHEDFIGKAIESVMMQNTNFNFELVIGEDFSTDKTRKICENYREIHGNKIKLLESSRNIGMVPNFLRTINECESKYVALLEGDDYWINPLKLQIQFDALERDKSISFVAHEAFVFSRIDDLKKVNYFTSFKKNSYFSISDILSEWLFPTASIVFRKELLIIPDWFINIRNWDWVIQILLASKKHGYYIDEPMSIYRKHLGGNSFNPDYSAEKTLMRQVKLLKLLQCELPNQEKDFLKALKSKEKSLKKYKLKLKYPLLYYITRPRRSFYNLLRRLLLNPSER